MIDVRNNAKIANKGEVGGLGLSHENGLHPGLGAFIGNALDNALYAIISEEAFQR